MSISLFEYQQMLARTSLKEATPAIGSDGVDEEGELHSAILDECVRRDWLAFHGSMAHKTYRTEGENDFHVLADRGRIFLVEAKSKHGKLSVKQLGVIAWAKKLGHTIHVVSSIQQFRDLVNHEF